MKEKCENPPVFRFTWPGKDEDYICAIHALKLNRIAEFMELHVQFIKLVPEEMAEHECSQEEGE